jgi:cobalt-zinc-cadmium efflux system outer membrane protein
MGVAGCHPPVGPDERHLADIDRLVASRTTSRIDAMVLLGTDPRVESVQLTGTLTLDEAVNRTLARNLSLIANSENLLIAQSQLAQAGLWINPTLGQTSAFYAPLSGQGGALAFDILISQTINTFFTRPYRVAVAEAQRFQTGIDLASQAFDLAEQASGKYAEMSHLLRDYKLALKVCASYKRAWDAAEARIKVGMIPRPDVNRAKLQYDDAQRQARHLRSQFLRAAREMNWLMGASSPPQWQLPPAASEVPDDLPSLPEVSVLETLGHRHRLDFIRADFDRKVADTNIKLAKLGMIPQITLGYDAARDSSKKWIAGPSFNLDLPIFDTGQVAVVLAQAQQRLADKTYVALNGQVSQDVRTAYDNIRISEEDVRFYRDQQIPLEEENVRLSELSFRLGNTDLDDLLNTLREYVSSLQAYEDALDAYNQNLIALERAVGMVLRRMVEQAAKEGFPTTRPLTTKPATRLTTGPTTQPAIRATTTPASAPATIPLPANPHFQNAPAGSTPETKEQSK